MAKYRVIHNFIDLQDNRHFYRAGEKYPRKGRVKKERIEELLGPNNKAGMPLIKEVEEGDV